MCVEWGGWVGGAYRPGTCRWCRRGCTPPPRSGPGTACRRCCAAPCYWWPAEKDALCGEHASPCQCQVYAAQEAGLAGCRGVSHLGGLRRAWGVHRAGPHAVGLVPAAQSEAAPPPAFVAAGQRAVTPADGGSEGGVERSGAGLVTNVPTPMGVCRWFSVRIKKIKKNSRDVERRVNFWTLTGMEKTAVVGPSLQQRVLWPLDRPVWLSEDIVKDTLNQQFSTGGASGSTFFLLWSPDPNLFNKNTNASPRSVLSSRKEITSEIIELKFLSCIINAQHVSLSL